MFNACKCALYATTNECPKGNFCWTNNICATHQKPPSCEVNPYIAIKSDCQCSSSSLIAECTKGLYCKPGRVCEDVDSNYFFL